MSERTRSTQVTSDARAGKRPEFDGILPPPDFVSVETTRYCNLRCRMCLQFLDGTTVTGPHMEWDMFERVAHELFPRVTRFQPSVSGEPTMSRGFMRMLELAARYGARLEICTNGTLLNERMRRLLIPQAGAVLFSFDGADKRTFESIREGADFDLVCRNIRAFCQESKERMGENRAVTGLACVLMRANIECLPDLVRLAKDLGVDFLACSHLHPVNDEMKKQSLVHARELAIEKIREAVSVAEELEFPFSVQPLDRLIAATAQQLGSRRELADIDGHVEGLGHVEVNRHRIPSFPTLDPNDPRNEPIVRLREEALASWRAAENPESPAADPGSGPPPGDEDLPESIWFCDFLWNKTYIALDGQVRTCCVPGAPIVGNVTDRSFQEVWRSHIYRAMRVALVRKDPVPICKGCQHIEEIKDPARIRRLLAGGSFPAGDQHSLQVTTKTPVLEWEPSGGARSYEVQFSTDGFRSLKLTTKGLGIEIHEPRFEIPFWLWDQAEVEVEYEWRVLGESGEGLTEAGRGRLTKTSAGGWKAD